MTRESILMQYQSECLEALKSVANIRKLAHIRIDFGGIMQAVGNER